MKSKDQKKKELDAVRALLEKAKSLIFVDFSKTPVSKIGELKAALREAGDAYKVMKKRLYRIAFKEKDFPVEMEEFKGQFAAIFSDKDISDAAGVVYRFAQERQKEDAGFTLIGGFDVEGKRAYGAQDVARIGSLPSRDILLAQLAGILNAPMNKLAYALSEIGKKK